MILRPHERLRCEDAQAIVLDVDADVWADITARTPRLAALDRQRHMSRYFLVGLGCSVPIQS